MQSKQSVHHVRCLRFQVFECVFRVIIFPFCDAPDVIPAYSDKLL